MSDAPDATDVPVSLGVTRRPPDPWCRWCGAPSDGADHTTCRRPLDPPRYCPTCRRRLRVLVTPNGVAASCRDHGPVAT